MSLKIYVDADTVDFNECKETETANSGEVLTKWADIKKQEKAGKEWTESFSFCNSFNKKRGILIHDAEKCNYCGLCQRRCPHKAIKVDQNKEIWKLRMICMKCGRCVRECPKGALSLSAEHEK